uniref:Uncharacterized protein n=1 Tax=Sphaerodactylus townsendi TaxID=933632 RepID=A0ACB8FBB3_9SAUR
MRLDKNTVATVIKFLFKVHRETKGKKPLISQKGKHLCRWNNTPSSSLFHHNFVPAVAFKKHGGKKRWKHNVGKITSHADNSKQPVLVSSLSERQREKRERTEKDQTNQCFSTVIMSP